MTIDIGTVDRLSEAEAALFHAYQSDIKVSAWVMIDRVIKINEAKPPLWRGEHATFEDYLWEGLPKVANGTQWKPSTYRQKKYSYEAYTLAKTNGVELSNAHAARALRLVQESLRVLVINLTVADQEMQTGEKPEQLTAAMITPVVEEINAVIDEAARTGHVDTGDGSMSAFGAAINVRLDERRLRMLQHKADGAKRGGWSKPDTFEFTDGDELQNAIAALHLKGITSEDVFEIRWSWRIVEEPCPEGEVE